MTYFLKSVLRVVCSPLREALKPRIRIPTRHAVWNV